MQFTWHHAWWNTNKFQQYCVLQTCPFTGLWRSKLKELEIVLCYRGIDEQVVCNKMQQALVNMRKTFRTQLPPVMLKLDSKRLKEHTWSRNTSSISLIIILCTTVLKDSCSWCNEVEYVILCNHYEVQLLLWRHFILVNSFIFSLHCIMFQWCQACLLNLLQNEWHSWFLITLTWKLM